MRYKIPAPHRYKIPPFPIPLSSWGLSPSTSALRYKRTSAPSSIFWHARALCLLLLLLTVADSRSLSLYPDASLSRILRLDPLAVAAARKQLLAADLITYIKPHYQVLSLPDASTPPTSSARPRPEPAALHLTRASDLLDLEIAPPDLSPYDR